MAIKSVGVTWANVATWLGLVGGALAFMLAVAFYAGQTQSQIQSNHAEAMAKLAKIEAAMPIFDKNVADLDKQLQHVRDTCCRGQTAAK